MVLARSLLLPLALLSTVFAQRTTYLDDEGYTVVASVQVDAEGDPTDTTTLIHITTGTPADAAATTAEAATTTQGNQGVVGQPVSLCTTAGCPVDPTTYTQATTVGGVVTSVIMTWTATTPTTPIPTWTSSGHVLSPAQYITTTVSASGLSRISSSAAHSLRSLGSPAGWLERWGGVVCVGVGVGLVGAVVVL